MRGPTLHFAPTKTHGPISVDLREKWKNFFFFSFFSLSPLTLYLFSISLSPSFLSFPSLFVFLFSSPATCLLLLFLSFLSFIYFLLFLSLFLVFLFLFFMFVFLCLRTSKELSLGCDEYILYSFYPHVFVCFVLFL